MGVIVDRKTRKKIISIFEHPEEVFSVYLKDSEDTIWIEGKVELYRFLRELAMEG